MARLLLALMTIFATIACGAADTDGAAARGHAGDGPSPAAAEGGGDGGSTAASDAGATPATPEHGRLADAPLPAFAHDVGSGLKIGLVSGRTYDDLASHTDERMRDLAALGVRTLRLEIEQGTPMTSYAKIVHAAKAQGIEVLALVTRNSLPGSPDPMAGTRADFDASFVPKVVAAIDAVTKALPAVRYVEVWNEPDVYSFQPFFSYANGTCTRLEGAFRYALLTVRVFETMNERRKQTLPTPTLVAFDFSRQDDTCVIDSVIDAQPIQAHRAGYRVPNGLPDGLPADIVSIHGYGLPNRIPGEAGYTYAGGTFADGVSAFLSHTFADGKPMLGAAPVWYTEVGFCLGGIGGGAAAIDRQGIAVTRALETLRSHPRITAAFVYSYRDDEPGGAERCGLRDNSATAFAPHPAYASFQAQAVADGDVVAPGGALEAKVSAAAVDVKGWAIDADGKAPKIEIAVDGAIVATLTDGNTPHPDACKAASSSRCPSVGFATSVPLPTAPGAHEIAARATDAAGNARVIGRVLVGE
jgi:hypothetical protein